MKRSMFYNKRSETQSRREIERIQNFRIRRLVKNLRARVPHYRRALGDTVVKSLADVRKLPFTTKDDLRENFPFGLTAVPLSEVVETHATSGTTGIPVVSVYTENDLNVWGEIVARSLVMAGMTKHDVFQITPSFGMFTGGFGFYHGARRIGATIVPTGAGFSKRQIQFMRDFGTTMISAIVSYALRLAEVAKEMGIDPAKDTKVRKGIFGAEMWSGEMKKRIAQLWDMDAYDIYGLTELCGPGVATDCQLHDGLHLWEDHFYMEVVDPKTGEQLEPEQDGELVLTALMSDGMPLLRYRTRDLTYIYDSGVCECGRTHRRISAIKGRTDDMLVVRGVNLWPSQIEAVLMKHAEVGPEHQVTIFRESWVDKMEITIEAKERINESQKAKLAGVLSSELKDLLLFTPEVKLVEPGSLPRVEVGKAKRIFDKRAR